MTIYVKRTVDRPLAGDTIPQHLQGILVLSLFLKRYLRQDNVEE